MVRKGLGLWTESDTDPALTSCEVLLAVCPSLSFSNCILFSVGGRVETFGDTLPLLGESGASSKLLVLLLLVLLGFWGIVGLAARAGFAPCGIGGFGLTGPPGELEEDVALRRGAGSGLVSIRGGVFSGEPIRGSGLLPDPHGGLLSKTVVWDLAFALLSGLSGLEDL